MQINHHHVQPVFYLLLIFLVVRPSYVQAQPEFVIKSANTQLSGSVHFLNAVFEIDLPDYIISAFSQGFDIPLALEIEVSKKRSFWFDEAVVTIKQQYRIQYHAILDSVSLMNVNSGVRLYFSSLDETLRHLSVLLEYPLLDNNALNQQQSYRARLNFGIDSVALPIPLKSSSLWKNDWNIVSEWYEWDITQ